MKLIQEATIKHMDGMIEISVIIDNGNKKKSYTYFLSSEYLARSFENLYRKNLHGKALAILNKAKQDNMIDMAITHNI